MTTDMRDPFQTRAIEWHVRLRDGDEATWEAFATWLEESPRHVEAYDQIEALDHAIDPLLPELAASSPVRTIDAPRSPARRRFGLLAGGALAASLAAGVLIGPQLGSQRYEIATVAGQQRSVRIDDRTQIVLNGASKVLLDRSDPAFAAVIYGQALFDVDHDPRHPFVVEVGAARIVDMGTVFDVVRDRTNVRVAVSEGRVEYDAHDERTPLVAGQALVATSGQQVKVHEAPREAVGAWRQGRLLYVDATLSQVADDIGRMLGISIRVVPSISRKSVSGNLNVANTSPDEIRRIEMALDVSLVKDGDEWVMGPPTSAPR